MPAILRSSTNGKAAALRTSTARSGFAGDAIPGPLRHGLLRCFSSAVFPSELFERSSKRSAPFARSCPVLLSVFASSLAAASRKSLPACSPASDDLLFSSIVASLAKTTLVPEMLRHTPVSRSDPIGSLRACSLGRMVQLEIPRHPLHAMTRSRVGASVATAHTRSTRTLHEAARSNWITIPG